MSLTLKSDSEDFSVEYNTPLNIDKLALKSFRIKTSWHNISEKYKNNKFEVNERVLTIPDGLYSIKSLNRYMIKLFGKNPILKFGIVEERERITIYIDGKISFESSDFNKLIGFEKKIYENGEFEGKYTADITRGDDVIFIHCDVVKGSNINSFTTDVIYSFLPTSKPSVIISKEFDHLIFFPVKVDSIDRIRMSIKNQNGKLIDLNKGYVEYNFVFKQKENYTKKIYELLQKLPLNKYE